MQVLINEVMISNHSLFETSSGEFPGWLELAVVDKRKIIDLQGWHLQFQLLDGTVKDLPQFPTLRISSAMRPLIFFIPDGSDSLVPSIIITSSLPEQLASINLVDTEGNIHNSFKIPEDVSQEVSFPIVHDISYIRDPQYDASIRITKNPSPGSRNDVLIPKPEFSLDSGFHSDGVLLDFSLPEDMDGWEIWYTVNDGVTFDEKEQVLGERSWIYPTKASGNLFTTPVSLTETSVVKARYYSPNGTPGPIVSKTYFVGESTELPVISLTMDPSDLWSAEEGIYTVGTDVMEPNYKEKWLRLAKMEYFQSSSDVEPSISDNYVIRLYGSSSRQFPLKSFALYAKAPGTTNRIPNLFFTGSAKDVPDFYSIVLRNSGGDVERSYFRDGLMTGLAGEYGLDTMDFQPAIVYVNGQFWGIMNIREKINEYFIEDHHGVDPDNINMVEGSYKELFQANSGDTSALEELLEYSLHLVPNTNILYGRYKELMDIDNFIDYLIFQSFFNNTDWPWSNTKLWHSPKDDIPWRWLLYDTDAGFDTEGYWTSGLDSVSGTPDFNFFQYLLQNRSDIFSSLFKQLMKNETFFETMVARYNTLLETALTSEKLLNKIDEFADAIDEDMGRHVERWQVINDFTGRTWNLSKERWVAEVEILRSFAKERPVYMKQYLEELAATHTALSPNNIIGGEFDSNSEFWNLRWNPDRVNQSITLLDTGSMGGKMEMLIGGTNYWESVGFVHDWIFIEDGEKVSFTFDVRMDGSAEAAQEIQLILYDPENNNTLIDYKFIPKTNWQTHTLERINTGAEILNGRLQFRVGKLAEGQVLYIDNVVMTAVEFLDEDE